MSSRFAADAHGRQIVVVTTPSAGLDVGMRFLLIGNEFTSAQDGVWWTGYREGRRPTAREMAEARAPYNPSARYQREHAEPVDDDLLPEPTAIELARLEQQRSPTDLVNVAA